MTKRARLAAATGGGLLVLCLLAVVLTVIGSDGEPSYKGFTMGQRLPYTGDPTSREALLILGTNNLDLLVQRMAYQQDKNWVHRGLYKLPARWRSRLYWVDRSASRRGQLAWEATQVLAVLETNMIPAIPELARIAGRPDSRTDYYADAAMGFLGALGEKGLATVAAAAADTNSHPIPRLRAVYVLGHYRTKSSVADLALTNALNDPDPEVRRAVWNSMTNP